MPLKPEVGDPENRGIGIKTKQIVSVNWNICYRFYAPLGILLNCKMGQGNLNPTAYYQA